jgi:GNAT superfamily N-acetyltransferase
VSARLIEEHPHVDVVDYRPDPDLDGDIADVCYAAVYGWPDQRPVTAALMRSWLSPQSLTANTLALHRDATGALVGAAALRWPAAPDLPTQLWGPIVHPSAQRHGLGRALLGALLKVAESKPGVKVISFGVPEARRAGLRLFERLGWTCSGVARIVEHPLPARALPLTHPVRTARAGEYLDPALAELVLSARPNLSYAVARDTYARWAADTRYTREGLLLVDGPDHLLGAALVYTLRHLGDPEPTEASVHDVIVRGDLDEATARSVRSSLIAAVLDAGAQLGAVVARSTMEDPVVSQALVEAGFSVVDDVRIYCLPS